MQLPKDAVLLKAREMRPGASLHAVKAQSGSALFIYFSIETVRNYLIP